MIIQKHLKKSSFEKQFKKANLRNQTLRYISRYNLKKDKYESNDDYFYINREIKYDKEH